MQSYPHDDFGHLEGASGYSVDFDDASSLHSSVLDPPPHSHPRDTLEDGQAIPADDAEAIQCIGDLNFDDLSISGLDAATADDGDGDAGAGGHGHGHALGHGDAHHGNGNVANLYEDDFEGMLDDLNRELPPHACRCGSLPLLALSSVIAELTHSPPISETATAGFTTRRASSSASSATSGSATRAGRRPGRTLSTTSCAPSTRR